MFKKPAGLSAPRPSRKQKSSNAFRSVERLHDDGKFIGPGVPGRAEQLAIEQSVLHSQLPGTQS